MVETVTQALRMATAAAPVLDDVLREGARTMLQRAIEREVAEYVEGHGAERDPRTGHRLVVRNGHLPARKVLTGLGPIEVRQPRVNDRRVDPVSGERRFRFTSRILPPYLRRAKSIEQLVPWLYLKGISSSDFPQALAALGVGHDGSGLSATNVVRMKARSCGGRSGPSGRGVHSSAGATSTSGWMASTLTSGWPTRARAASACWW